MIATPPAIQQKLPVCRAEVLEVRLGRGEGAAGTVFIPIVFTNTGPASCTLRGFPRVSSVNAHWHRIGAPATRTGGRVRTVTLAPGGSASAVVGLTQALNYPKARCRPLKARALRIYPPNETRSRILALEHLACSRNVAGSSSIRAVRR